MEKGYPGKKDHTVFVTRGVFVPGNMTNTEGIQRPIQQVVFCLLMKIKKTYFPLTIDVSRISDFQHQSRSRRDWARLPTF